MDRCRLGPRQGLPLHAAAGIEDEGQQDRFSHILQQFDTKVRNGPPVLCQRERLRWQLDDGVPGLIGDRDIGHHLGELGRVHTVDRDLDRFLSLDASLQPAQ